MSTFNVYVGADLHSDGLAAFEVEAGVRHAAACVVGDELGFDIDSAGPEVSPAHLGDDLTGEWVVAVRPTRPNGEVIAYKAVTVRVEACGPVGETAEPEPHQRLTGEQGPRVWSGCACAACAAARADGADRFDATAYAAAIVDEDEARADGLARNAARANSRLNPPQRWTIVDGAWVHEVAGEFCDVFTADTTPAEFAMAIELARDTVALLEHIRDTAGGAS